MKKVVALQLLVILSLVFSFAAKAQVASAGGNLTFNYTATAKVGGDVKEVKEISTIVTVAATKVATRNFATKQHMNLLPEVGYAFGANKTANEVAETNQGSTKTMSEELEAWVANELTLKKSRIRRR